MANWHIMVCILGALTAALVFLSLVAHELIVFDRVLEYRKKVREEREARRIALMETAG